MTMFPNRFPALGAVTMVFVFGLLSLLCFGAKQEKTVDFENGTVVDRVTFDPAIVKPEELARWMELSPILGRGNFMLVPEWIEFCPTNDPRYHGCDAKPDEWNPNLTNAQVTLSAISARIEKLTLGNYPTELAEVVKYIRTLQAYTLWEQQHELSFLKSNDIGVLEEEYERIKPRAACESVLKSIQSTTDISARSHLVRFDWRNCMWSAAEKELGPYPLEQWKSFLGAHGIQEKQVEEDIDD